MFSLSTLPLSLCHSPHLRARAQLFGRDKAGRGLFFYFFLCRLLNALWSIPKRLILFRERFPISLMLFNNSSSLFYGLVSALEGLPKPGCVWIISLWSSPSRELHQLSSVYWRQINTRTDIHKQFGHWDYNTKHPCIHLDVQETGRIKSAVQQMDLFCCGVSAVCHSCSAPVPYVLKEPKIHSPSVEACTNKDGSSERDFVHLYNNNIVFTGNISQHDGTKTCSEADVINKLTFSHFWLSY